MTCVRAHAHVRTRARALTRFDNELVKIGRATLRSRRAFQFSTIAGFYIKYLFTPRAALNAEFGGSRSQSQQQVATVAAAEAAAPHNNT